MGASEGDGAVVSAVVVEVRGAVEEARARPALVREVGLRAVAGLVLDKKMNHSNESQRRNSPMDIILDFSASRISFISYLVLLARMVVLHVNPLPTLAGQDFAADVAQDLAAAGRRLRGGVQRGSWLHVLGVDVLLDEVAAHLCRLHLRLAEGALDRAGRGPVRGPVAGDMGQEVVGRGEGLDALHAFVLEFEICFV